MPEHHYFLLSEYLGGLIPRGFHFLPEMRTPSDFLALGKENIGAIIAHWQAVLERMQRDSVGKSHLDNVAYRIDALQTLHDDRHAKEVPLFPQLRKRNHFAPHHRVVCYSDGIRNPVWSRHVALPLQYGIVTESATSHDFAPHFTVLFAPNRRGNTDHPTPPGSIGARFPLQVPTIFMPSDLQLMIRSDHARNTWLSIAAIGVGNVPGCTPRCIHQLSKAMERLQRNPKLIQELELQ